MKFFLPRLSFAGSIFLMASCLQLPLLAQASFESLTNSASIKYGSRDFAGAIADYTALIKLAPEKAELYYNRALARQDSKDFNGAVADYSKAIQINPNFADAYNNRGNTKAALKDYAGAIADFDRAIKLNPRLPTAFFNRANAKRQLKDYAEAMADAKKCLEVDSKHLSAYGILGLAQYNLRQWRPALETYRKLLEANRGQDDYSRFRIWLLRVHLGESEEATKELSSHIASLKGDEGNSWPAQIGRFLTGSISEEAFLRLAESSARTSEDKSGQACEANFYVGAKRIFAGDKAKAVTFFQKCVDTGRSTFDEYSSAEAELVMLDNR